jgi:hypothetical protein
MFGIIDIAHVARILYQSMLEASSGAEERPSPLARKQIE